MLTTKHLEAGRRQKASGNETVNAPSRSMGNWLKRPARRRKKPAKLNRHRAQRRPVRRLEELEDRALLSVSYANVPAAMDAFLPALQDGVSGVVNGKLFPVNGIALPLVGAALSKAVPETQFLTTLQTDLDKQSGVLNANSTTSDVETKYFQAALKNTPWTIAFNSVTGDVDSGNPDDPANNKVTFHTTLTETVPILGKNADTGLLGLHLDLSKSPLNLSLTYTVNLDFVVDNTKNDNDVLLDITAPDPLLSAEAVASLQNLNFTTTIGPLNISVTDGQLPAPWVTQDGAQNTKSQLDATLVLKENPNPPSEGFSYTDSTLSTDLNQNNKLDLKSTQALINLGIVISGPNQDFPSIAANLNINWPFTGDAAGTIPSVAFDDVQLDIGSFFTKLVGPVIADIQKITKPLQPVVESLHQRIPVLSDLSDAIGKGDVTLESIINSDTLTNFDNDVDFINKIKLSSGSAVFHLGSFNITGTDVRSQELKNAVQTITTAAHKLSDDLKNDGIDAGNLNSLLDPSHKAATDQAEPLFQFPILDHPEKAFDLLLGKDVALFTCHLINEQALAPKNGFSDFYPIFGPLGIQVDGSFELDGNFDFGYDTWGLQHGNALNGFFVVSSADYTDFDGTMHHDDQAGLKFSAHLDAGPGINVVLASVNVTGGIDGKATLALNSPYNSNMSNAVVHSPPGNGVNMSKDGRIRLQDLESDESSLGVLGFLQASGEVDASLDFHAQVGVPPLAVNYDKVLAKTVLVNFDLNGQTDKRLAGLDTAQPDPAIPGAFTFSNPNNPGELILNMGPYSMFRDKSKPGDGDEDFTVTFVSQDPNNSNAETVEVSAFGISQQYEGVTKIFAEGGYGNNTITIDPKVLVPVEFYGSIDPADPNYINKKFVDPKELNFMTDSDFRKSKNVLQAGGGDGTLVGGQGTDLLIGGSANNSIQGGQAQAGTTNQERLVGGTGKSSKNKITGGQGGDNTLIAGPNGDLLAGNFFGAQSNVFVAGAGNDTLVGFGGANVFHWQEGDGNPTIQTFGPDNTLDVVGVTAADQFHAQAKFGTLTVTVTIPTSGGLIQRTLQATGIQTLSMDDGSDGSSYQVDDLAGTTIQRVDLSLHEAGNQNGAPDQITVNGSPTLANTVDIRANANVLTGNSFSYDSSGNPIANPPTYGQATDIDLNIAGADIGPNGGSPPAHYVITAAIPKSTDTLTVNTGQANDTVSVESTQGYFSDNVVGGGGPPNLGGSVYVNTIGGDNTINVGASTPGAGEGLLDRIQGNLYIDAGTGTKNVLNLDESGATNGDTLALTASLAGQLAYQLLRYTGESLSSNPDGGGPGGKPLENNRYPMLIQYGVDLGGGFGGGINLYLPRPLTQTNNTLYITDTFPLAKTTVYTDGKAFVGQQTDEIIVGFNPPDASNPAHSPQTSMLSNTPGMPDNLLGFLDIEGTDWAHNAVGGVDLAVYDEAAAANSQYTVTNHSVGRLGMTPITYNDLGISTVPGSVALYAANAANTIAVQSTAAYAPATVDTGTSTSSVTVGFPILPPQPLYVLDTIQGALTVLGGGTAGLALEDNANLSASTYDLNATTMQRLGGVAIAPIKFNKMTTVDVYDAAQANNMTNLSGTAAGTTVTVHTGDGTDGLNVTTLDQILGSLAFVWKSGIKNLVANDTSAAGVDTYTVGPLVLKRTGAADINYDPLATFELDTSSAQDANVNMPAINSGTQEKIVAGAGANKITVASGGLNLNSIQGGLSVNGGGNTNLFLEDQNTLVARSYTLTAGEFQAVSVPAQPPMIAPVDFANLTSLTLDSGNQGNTTDVDATAAGNHVTINAGTGDAVTVGKASNSLNPVLGRVDVVGVGSGDNLTVADGSGNPMALYTLTDSEIDHPPTAPIGYQGLARVLLEGSNSGDVYRLNSVPATTRLQIAAAGTSNTLFGPNLDNTWEFEPGVFVVDTNASFSGIQGIVGGSADDTFKYEGSIFNGTIDGGGGHNKIDTGLDKFETITLQRGSASNNGFYGWLHSVTNTFDQIDSIVSLAGDGSTLDGSSPNFTGDFTGTLTVSGFDSFSLSVPGNFSGSLLASTEGTAANPIGPITIGGSVTATAVIKVGFLNTFSVTGDMAGTLKGFGVDANVPTIGTISIGGNLTATGQVITAGQIGSYTNGGNLGGTVDENTPPGVDMRLLSVGGSLTGTVNAGAIAEIVITKDLSGNVVVSGPIGTMSVGGNFSGNVTAASVGDVTIDGSDTGKISAGQITSIGVMHATGPVPLDVTQNGSEDFVLIKGGNGDTFAIFYDGKHGAIPAQAHVRVNPQPLPPGLAPDPCDISLLVNGNGKFNLARLDSVGPGGQPAAAHVRDVVVEGDVLATDSPAAMQFFHLPAGTPGGVQLPMDDLGSVAATDNMSPGTVVAHTLQGLAFGSFTKPDGTTVMAPDAQERDTAIIAILIGLPLPPIETTMMVPVSTRGPVALFLANHGGSQAFDANDVLLADEAGMFPLGPPLDLNPDLNTLQVQPNTALGGPSQGPGVIQTVAFTGDGGSLTTKQPITQAITSTGPLGDLTLLANTGLTADVTASSILGSISVPKGPITGTIQTTGLRTDPATGATTQLPATLGRLTVDSAGNLNGATQIMAGEGITGRIISRGDLISRVISHSGVSGLIAAQGNIGALLTNATGSPVVASNGRLTRFGGVESDGGFRGTLLALGNAYGDIHIAGGLAGQIAVQGQQVPGLDPQRMGILGNVDIKGPVRHNAKIISGGEIGDAAGGTTLDTAAIEGTVAALGDINLAKGVKKHADDARFFGGDLTGANAAALEAVFGTAFDMNPAALDLQGLDQMLANLAALRLTRGGGPSTPAAEYVAAVYNDLLARGPDPGGNSYWTGRVTVGSPRGAIATDLTHSDEYFATIIRPFYEQYLGRDPDAAGLQFWTNQMRAGLTDEHLEAGFIGSQEFYNHSGGTNKLWVDAMYLKLLGRGADPGGGGYWTDQLNHGANRANVAYGFAASIEREQHRVGNDYLDFLGRLPDQAGLDYWVHSFASGMTNEELITGFIASQEYFQGNTDAP